MQSTEICRHKAEAYFKHASLFEIATAAVMPCFKPLKLAATKDKWFIRRKRASEGDLARAPGG